MTSTTDLLVDDAYQKVWCAPGQDRQYIVGPARITGRNGNAGSIRVGLGYYNLPSKSDWYHVFTIGDLPPELVGMSTIPEKWVNVRAHCVETSLLIDLYVNAGIRYPTYLAYFLYTRHGQLLIAFRRMNKIADLGKDQPFIRWRSNAWFEGVGRVPRNKGIEIEGEQFTTTANFATYQAKWRAAKLAQGYAWAFVNGRRVTDINTTTAKAEDWLEYVRDASVRQVVEVPMKSLKAFDSILDKKQKFLLTRAGLGTTIDYVDDVDVYILNYLKSAAYDGLFYHQNQVDAIRNVTHRDYSFPTGYVHGVVLGQPTWKLTDDIRVELIIRNSGLIRPLVNEAHRIKELFKLSETNRIKVMIGELSNVPVWKAENLEASQYPAVMRADDGAITLPQVVEAYGYNAIGKLIGDTPIKRTTDPLWVKLPPGLHQRSTMYEYDRTGKLLGWYPHELAIEYAVNNSTCVYVEGYTGKGGVGISTIYDQVTSTLMTGVDYRFYVCGIINGKSDNHWVDVTGDGAFYTIANNVVTWKISLTKYHTAVRNDLDFLAADVEVDYRDELITMTVRLEEIRSGLVPIDTVMDIPPGEVDLFMNGWGMIEGLDYYGQWPEFCVVNKAYLIPGTKQKLTVRGRGFCTQDLKLDHDREWGYIRYGQLSRDARYKVRDDKVSRVTINGALYSASEVVFAEDGKLLNPPVANGTPYQITHPIIPMTGYTGQSAYKLRALSRTTDKSIEDFMTLYKPETTVTGPDAIPTMYRVFSPFTAKLIYDMLNGILLMDEYLQGDYSDEYLKQRLAGYDWILKYDPAINGVDEKYVYIEPHPEEENIALTLVQYRLLDRAVKLFLAGKVAINRKVVIVN